MVTWKFVLVVFVTGADHIPPMGFENKLTLSFDHDSLYPIASTCLYLPTRFIKYEEFKTGMMEGIISGFGFGRALYLITIEPFMCHVYMFFCRVWL